MALSFNKSDGDHTPQPILNDIYRLRYRAVFVENVKTEGVIMTSQSNTTQWRKRQAALGFVRVQVQVRNEDASLVREIASVLRDPSRHEATRSVLRKHITPSPAKSFKALLASAPLADIELDRSTDSSRENDP